VGANDGWLWLARQPYNALPPPRRQLPIARRGRHVGEGVGFVCHVIVCLVVGVVIVTAPRSDATDLDMPSRLELRAR